MKISNIKIRYKILACFVLLGAVVVGVIWFATSKMKAIDNIYSQIIANDVIALQASTRFQGYIYNFNGLIWLVAEDNTPTKEDYRGYRSQPNGHVRKFRADQKHAPKLPNIEQAFQNTRKFIQRITCPSQRR